MRLFRVVKHHSNRYFVSLCSYRILLSNADDLSELCASPIEWSVLQILLLHTVLSSGRSLPAEVRKALSSIGLADGERSLFAVVWFEMAPQDAHGPINDITD